MAQSVLFVDRVPHPAFNGVSRYMEELAAFAAQETHDLQIEMLFWGMRLKPSVWTRLSRKRRQLPQRLVALNRKVLYPFGERRSKADLLHFPAHGIPEKWLNTDKKCLLSVHGAAAQIAPEWDTDARRAEQLRRSLAVAAKADHAFVTFSDFAKQEIVEHYGLDPQSISVIPHGVDHEHFQIIDPAVVAEFRKRQGLETPYILYVGPCAPRKNVLRMVEAYAAAKQRGDIDHDFVIAGRPHPHQEDIERRAAKLGVAKSVKFRGPVAHADLPLLYNGADAFAFVSLYEGFGLPVLEAMACGTPVITNAETATGEIADNAAMLVKDPRNTEEIASAFLRVLGDSDKTQQLCEAGLQRARQYTWAESAHQHFALYRRLIGNTDGGE